jgi:hypothetical protein
MTPNPLAPRTPRQVRRQARYAVGATFNPLFAQLNRREASNQAAIRDYTRSLSSMLAPIAGQIQGYYNNATAQQQGVDTALANRLNSVGGQEASALQQRLASAGLPTDQAQRVSAVGSVGRRTRAPRWGARTCRSFSRRVRPRRRMRGSCRVSRRWAGCSSRSRTSPRWSSNGRDLQAKVPGAIQSELGQLQNLEFQKATANLGFAGTQAKLGAQIASSNARLATTQRGQNISHADRQAALQVRQQQARASAAAKQQVAHQKRERAFYSVRDKTFTEAKRLYKGTTSSAGGSANPFAPTGTTKAVSVPYGQAYRNLWSHYGTQLVNQYGYKRSAVDTMIRRALVTAGYTSPQQKRSGGFGRCGGGDGGRRATGALDAAAKSRSARACCGDRAPPKGPVCAALRARKQAAGGAVLKRGTFQPENRRQQAELRQGVRQNAQAQAHVRKQKLAHAFAVELYKHGHRTEALKVRRTPASARIPARADPCSSR